jgi:hypothetical protein
MGFQLVKIGEKRAMVVCDGEPMRVEVRTRMAESAPEGTRMKVRLVTVMDGADLPVVEMMPLGPGAAAMSPVPEFRLEMN